MTNSPSNWESWKQPYRHGALVLYPPKSIRNYINRFREILDPVSYSYAAAHITLTQPFTSVLSGQMIDAVEQIVSLQKPFEITFGPLQSFLPSPVMYVKIEPHSKILCLRRQLHDLGLFDLTLPHTEGFVPHMTLAEGLSGPPVDETLLHDVRRQVSNGSFKCDRIVHIVPNSDFRFIKEREFRFAVA